MYRVLIPRFIAVYTYHLNGTSRITDAPTIRSLNFILQDEFEDWRDGEMLLQSLHRHARRKSSERPADSQSSRRCTWRRAASPAPVAWENTAAGGTSRMKKFLAESELARDERFVRTKIEDRVFDPRGAKIAAAQHRSGQDGHRPSRRGRALPLADARHLRR